MHDCNRAWAKSHKKCIEACMDLYICLIITMKGGAEVCLAARGGCRPQLIHMLMSQLTLGRDAYRSLKRFQHMESSSHRPV